MSIHRCLGALVLVSFGCSSNPGPTDPVAKLRPATVVQLHIGRHWFTHRAEYLGITPEEAHRRDALLDENTPPSPNFWDDQIAQDTATVWRVLCNECHPGKRSIEAAKFIEPPPEGWPPATDGVFFGEFRSHRAVYRKISEGGNRDNPGPEGPMPSFAGDLSHEQIWALVYFIEVASRKGAIRLEK